LANYPTSSKKTEPDAKRPTPKRMGSSRSLGTRRGLLAAAETCLRENGYNALSTRQVALAAGVPLSPVHYHFGSKQGLLLALFRDLSERLLHRQTEMFISDLPLWRRWELACDYLDEDLASGYVRILNELTAAGWSDPEINDAIRQAIAGWNQLLVDVARSAGEQFEGFGPMSPEDVASLVSSVFIGAEMNILSGHENKRTPVRRALRRMGKLIKQFEMTTANGE